MPTNINIILMKKQLSILLMAAIFLATQCKKAEEDSTPPTIDILSPEAGSNWTQADSVRIEAAIADEDLHKYSVKILKNDDDIFEFETHTHDQNVLYKKSWFSEETGQFLLRIEAEDHNGNSSSKQINFFVVN